ncbi:hypothetical protein KAW50_03660 [candidate division WOR-3 bacterium]|nr:hypothetical protein [candidate division WOR-3 bacterium]
MTEGLSIKIIGTMGFIPKEWRSRLAKKYTSCQISWDKKLLQIDIGNRFEGSKLDYLLITHIHYDHVEQFATCPSSTEVLVPSATFIPKLERKNSKVNFRLIKGKSPLDGLSVRPFPVLHSSTTLTYGFKFFWNKKEMVWLPDYCIVPLMPQILSGVDVLFLGAAAMRRPIDHKGYGHCQGSVYELLKKISNLRNPPKEIFLIHFGMGMAPIRVKTIFLQKMFPKLSIHYTWDGKKIEINGNYWLQDGKKILFRNRT